MNIPSWGYILLRTQPIEIYEDIREDLIRIYIKVYEAYPAVRYELESRSVEQLREDANQEALAARTSTPENPVTGAQQLFGSLYRAIETSLYVLFVVSAVIGGGTWLASSRGALQALDAIPGVIEIIVGGPFFVAVAVAVLVIYARLLTLNSLVVQSLTRKLAIGGLRTNTRQKPRLVGYLIWNSALTGGSGIKLLSVFMVLKGLSTIPRLDPYGYVLNIVEENIHIFAGASGRREVTKKLYYRLRADA